MSQAPPSDPPGRVTPHRPAPRLDGFDGLAGPGSLSWRVNGEMILLLGWGRAILLQLAHPLVAAGVAEHSHFREGPLARARRLRHTLGAIRFRADSGRDRALRMSR